MRAREVIIRADDPLGAIKHALERLPETLGRVHDIPEAFTDMRKCVRGMREPIRDFRPGRAGTRVGRRGWRAWPNEVARVESRTSGRDRRWVSTRAETGPWNETASVHDRGVPEWAIWISCAVE